MLRVGIVGSDNSHALAYSSLLNVERVAGPDARAVAIWGQEPERTREVAEKGRIDTIVATPEEMLDSVDAVFVEDRHGDLHAEHALPFLERGLPVFVDKPLAIPLKDMSRLIAAANASGSFLTSFSSLRTAESTDAIAAQAASIGAIRVAHFAGPCDFESIYGGPFFYATHAIEIALRLVGEDLASVSAVRAGKNVVVTAVWADETIAAITYLSDAKYHFGASLYGTEGMATGEVLANHDGYRTAIGIVLDGMASGKRPFTDEQMVRPVAVVHAIQQSLANGGASVEVAPLIALALGA
ncbi:MAG: Gfo/Idh/MocA family oxidoreductase [Chloroflexota bacterium]|nr:Gfo/Idh/MocA family oxidoreductase [Chloroflexota bacterium]